MQGSKGFRGYRGPVGKPGVQVRIKFMAFWDLS